MTILPGQIALAALLASASTLTAAATYTVDRTTDPQAGASRCTAQMCSLRGAISSANLRAGPDRIVLAAGTYTLTLTGAGEDDNRTGDLDIHDDLTISGERSANTIVQWATPDIDRLLQFHVGAPDRRLLLDNLTLRNGDSGAEPGGALLSEGAIGLRNVALIDNRSDAYAAGIALQGVPAGALPVLELAGVRFQANVAALNVGGGAIDIGVSCGDVTIDDATFTENAGGNGGAIWFGGCIQSPSQVLVRDSRFVRNQAYTGGALRIQAGNVVRIEDSMFEGNRMFPSFDAPAGGAIHNAGAVLEIVGSTFVDNRALDIGGASLGKGGAIGGTAPRLIEDGLFDGNGAGEEGGALHVTHRVSPFLIRRTRFVDNSTDAFGADQRAAGGAIFIDYGAQALPGEADRIVSSHFEGNLAPGPNADDGGGAIHKRGATPLLIEASSFVANLGAPGGAIHAHECNDSPQQTSLAIRNSTLSANSAPTANLKRGGAIAITGCALALDGVTFAANTADQGSALYALAGAVPAHVELRNTLLAGTCHDAGAAIDDLGGNIESPGDGCRLQSALSQPLIPPGLLLLGPRIDAATAYYVPALASAVIDAGLPIAECPATDQRGLGRIDARCDVGAVEASNPMLFGDGFETTSP